MGQLMQYLVSIIFVMCLLFFASSLFSDANAMNGNTYTESYSSFNKTSQYGSYFQNQTNQMKEQLVANTNQNANANAFGTALVLLNQGVNMAALSFIGFIDIGLALLNDAAIYLAIPGFFIAMAVLLVIMKVVFGIYEAIRVGRI